MATNLPDTSYFQRLNTPGSGAKDPAVFQDLNAANNPYYESEGVKYLKHSQYGGIEVNNKLEIVYDSNGRVKIDPKHLLYGQTGGNDYPTPHESVGLMQGVRTGVEAGTSIAGYKKNPYYSASDIINKQFSKPDLTVKNIKNIGLREDNNLGSPSPVKVNIGKQDADSLWISNAFLVPSMSIKDLSDQYNRYWSSASLKFYDTTMGGNIACNARPQANWYADIRDPGRLVRNEASVTDYRGNFGLGTYYSEAIDDPAQRVYITFGTPQFNSISNFVRRAFDSDQILLTKTGREKSIWYKAAQTIAQVTLLVKAPIVAATWLFAEITGTLFSSPMTKYYTLKSGMYHYWSVVDNLVNNIAVTSGLISRLPFSDPTSKSPQRPGRPYKMDSDHFSALNKFLPEVITETKVGNVKIVRLDVYAMATRAQGMYNRMFLQDYNNANKDNGTATDYRGYVKKNNAAHSTYITNAKGQPSLYARLAELVTSSYYSVDSSKGNMNKTEMHPSLKEGGLQNDISTKNDDKTDLNTDDPDLVKIPPEKSPTSGGTNGKPTDKPKEPTDADISSMELKESSQEALDEDKTMQGHKTDAGWWDKIKGELSALYNDGAKFAIFSVEHTGSVSSSFSNSYGESDLSNKLNSESSKIREMRFSFADGNLFEGAGKVVQSVLSAAGDVAMGALDGLTMGFSNILRGLAGNGYLDIPKHWMSSQAQLPRMTYNMTLISPYGNLISRLQNIYVPLCMILAGALPRATGKSSYGPPFICQVFDVGRFQTKLGAIESLSVTVGTSNLPFNLSGKPLAIDVSFTVIDLSSILYMPVSAGGPLENINIAMDEDNTLVDYLAVLAGQDIYSQIYPFPKARLNLAKKLNGWSKITSEAFQASLIHEKSLNGGGLFYVARPFAKTIEAISKGTASTQSIDDR